MHEQTILQVLSFLKNIKCKTEIYLQPAWEPQSLILSHSTNELQNKSPP